MLQLSQGGKVESVFHIPKSYLAYYGMEAQKHRVCRQSAGWRSARDAWWWRRWLYRGVTVDLSVGVLAEGSLWEGQAHWRLIVDETQATVSSTNAGL
eukprot:779921-Prymnesium_polylepis.1